MKKTPALMCNLLLVVFTTTVSVACGSQATSTGGTGTGGSAGVSGAGGAAFDGGLACTGPNYSNESYTYTFTATPKVIAPGQSSTLGWSHPNATTLSIDHGIGSVLGQSSKVVTPAQTTTYTLTMDGSLPDSLTVFVTGKRFAPVGSMTVTRSGHTATLLPNGKVLVVGGTNDASAELYNPGTGTFTATGNMAASKSGHSATLLADGKVLIVGGASAELFDPTTGTFAATGNPIVPRNGHTATLLASGKVLIAGGYAGTSALASAELFDPGTGKFTAVGNLAIARASHVAMLLRNGTVLLAGGFVSPHDTNNYDGLDSADLYDPANATFTATGNMGGANSSPTAVLLASGAVLVAGAPHGFEGWTASGSLVLYDPVTGTFGRAPSLMVAKRALHTTTLLPNGLVLLAGGHQDGPSGDLTFDVASAELCDPAACSCTLTASMTIPRSNATATLLLDGSVLVAGGASRSSALASAELYR